MGARPHVSEARRYSCSRTAGNLFRGVPISLVLSIGSRAPWARKSYPSVGGATLTIQKTSIPFLKSGIQLLASADCCTMLHMNKNIPPPTRPTRVSVPISFEALQAFERLAKAGNMSTGRAIAEWLDDTIEASAFLALKLEQAREAPKMVMREIHSYALGLADETGELMRKLVAKGKADRAAASGGHAAAGAPLAAARSVVIPPSCNTGGKVHIPTSSVRGRKAVSHLPPAKVQAHANTNGVPPKAAK